MTATSETSPDTPAKLTLLILGCGGHARSVAGIALSLGYGKILLVDAQARPQEAHFGCKVVHPEAVTITASMVGLAASGHPGIRQEQTAWLEDHQVPVTTLIAPRTDIGPEVKLGKGVFVASGVYIGPKAEIGAGCILNTGAVIEHDVCIGDFSHVSVQATVAGYSRVGSRCMIGAGATVIDRVRIPDQTTIGAGATVIRDVPVAGTYVGCPARLVAHDTP